MSEYMSHEALKRAYRPFERVHDQHREELLEAISKGGIDPEGTSVRIGRGQFAGIALSVAAVLLASATLAVALWPTTASPAAAVEQVRKQLFRVQSLYLKGWIFQTVEEDGELKVRRFPYEFYAGRPSRYWHNGYGFSYEREHKLTNVTHRYRASDGARTISVSHDQRLAVIQPANQLEAQLTTERFLQEKIFDRLVVGLPESYRYVRTEDVQGVPCDVYEYRELPKEGFGHRRRLWLNARTGIPVRMKCWTIFDSGREEPSYEYHTIRINGPPRQGMFLFEAPEDYRVNVIEGEAGPLSLPEGASAAGGNLSLRTWIPFNIDNRAVLYCWWVDPPIEKEGLLQRMPEFSLARPGEKEPCRYLPLRTDPRWNWSLLLPQRDGEQIDVDDHLSVVVKGERARLHSGGRPLRLPAEQLERILLEAQKATIPPGSDVEPFTLEDIRALMPAAGKSD